MLRLRLVAAASSLGLLAFGPAAYAKSTVAPPGNSGVDQYLEVVPAAAGDQPSTHRSGGPALPKRVAHRLQARGADGRALSRIIDATAPAAARRAAKRTTHPPAASSATVPGTTRSRADHPSVLSSAASALRTGSEDGGMGVLLPLILVASAGGTAALVLLRRRA